MFGLGSFSCSQSPVFHIEPQFEAVMQFNQGIAAVSQNGLWGFIDTAGKWVINPQFIDVILSEDKVYSVADSLDNLFQILKSETTDVWQILPFQYKKEKVKTSLGLMTIFKENEKFGLKDNKEKTILEAIYDKITYIGENLFIINEMYKGDQLIGANGKKLTDFYDEITPEIQFNRIRFRHDEKYGLLSKEGKVILKPCMWLLEIVGHHIACTIGGDYVLHTDQLKPLSDFKFDRVIHLENGHWMAKGREFNNSKIFDENARIIAENISISDGKMMFGRIPVQITQDEWGYIDSWGKQVMPQTFEYVESFWSNGNAIFWKSGTNGPNRRGLIDTLGNVVLDPIYDEILWHPDGVFMVTKDRTIQLLDSKFRPITKKSKNLLEYVGNGIYLKFKMTWTLSYQKSNWYTGDKSKIYKDKNHKVTGVYAINGALLVTEKDYDEEEPLPVLSEGFTAAKKGKFWGFVKYN
jgi:hypothetical protein